MHAAELYVAISAVSSGTDVPIRIRAEMAKAKVKTNIARVTLVMVS